MAINILTEPTDPPVSGDFTRDQAIQHANEVPALSLLSLWESTAAAPVAKQGAFIRHAGNTFQVQSADETISGSPSAGLNYIIASESAGVITLAWATSLTGFAYNPAYGGIYNGSVDQVLPDICYLDGTDYKRGRGLGQDYNVVFLSDGSIITQGAFSLPGSLEVGGDFTLTGGFTNPLSLGASTSGTQSVPASGTYLLPAGIYFVQAQNSVITLFAQVRINGAWENLGNTYIPDDYPIVFISDGTNGRLSNTSSSFARDVYWRKF